MPMMQIDEVVYFGTCPSDNIAPDPLHDSEWREMTPVERARIIEAVRQWISAKEEQGQRSLESGRAQAGTRAQVTGGTHMNGVNRLIVDEITALGVADVEFQFNRRAVLAGWYRSSKAWDLLVLQRGQPVLAVEYKSMAGSEGKNLNNRADEVFGIAEDAREAERRGILPPNLRRAYIYVLEITPAVEVPVGIGTPYGSPDSIFQDASYLSRVAIMCERMVESGLYHLAWVVGVTREPLGFREPSLMVGWDTFAAELRRGFHAGQALPASHD
ncbi:MAG TPA: PaeR7I family type II restriction endonuclease [Streptosporangiaceae bacterium]|nr:PaeR7I family type II restriction endonuclease [Streptosporangiaceae bacterium]